MIITRHLRQNRLSKESRAASRSFPTKLKFGTSWPLLEPPTAFSSFTRISYLACIRRWTVFHISVKPAQSKWETAGPKLTL